jgi:hypothetical protein
MSVGCVGMATAQGYFIGVGGQARSGKDTLGRYLVQRLNEAGKPRSWEQRKFADPVKRMFMEAFDVNEEFIESWKTRAEPPPGFHMPVRACLTLIGDGFRRMRPTVWIDKVFRSSTGGHCVVTDVRYLNEVQSIRDRGGVVILLYRPGFENDLPTPSEQELVPLVQQLLGLGTEGPVRGTDLPCDYFLINRGSVDDLYRKADELIFPDLSERVQISRCSRQ